MVLASSQDNSCPCLLRMIRRKGAGVNTSRYLLPHDGICAIVMPMGRTNIVSVDLVEGGGGVAVSLWDEQFRHLRVDLRFEDEDDQLPLDSICVQRDRIDSMPNPAISTQELRAEFPWTTWERAARAAAANFLISHSADRRPGLSRNELFEPRTSFDALLLDV